MLSRLSTALLFLAFTAAENTAFAVKIDVAENGSLLVEGKPFFPFGFFGNSGVAEEDVRVLGDAGFNIYHCNNVCGDGMYQLAEAKGVYIVHEIWWQNVALSVRSAREQKNLFAWYVGDDFNYGTGCNDPRYTPAELKARGETVLAEDFPGDGQHATTGAAVGDADCHVAEYRDSLKFIQIESYPIGNDGAESGWLDKHASNARWALEELGERYPFLANTQTFNWPDARYPTAPEIWNMNIVSLIYGAKGFIAYSFAERSRTIVNDAPDVWAEMRREVPEMKLIAPFITEGERSEVAMGNPSLHAALFRRGDDRLLMVANTSRTLQAGVKLNVSISREAVVMPFLSGRASQLSWRDGALQGSLGAEAAELYLFRPRPGGTDAGLATDAKSGSDQGGSGGRGGTGSEPPAGPAARADRGCGCKVGSRFSRPPWPFPFAVVLLLLRSRRFITPSARPAATEAVAWRAATLVWCISHGSCPSVCWACDDAGRTMAARTRRRRHLRNVSFFALFKKDPVAKLRRRIAELQEQAMELQRRGKILEYSEAIAQAEALERELEAQ